MTYVVQKPTLMSTPNDVLAAFGPFVARRTPESFDNRPYTRFAQTPVTPTTGAESSGIRLSGDLPGETLPELRRALLEWKVLFFRNQAIDRSETLPRAGASWKPTLF